MESILHQLDWRIRIFDSLSYPTLVLNSDRTIIAANKVFLDRYKTTLDEVIGKNCHDHLFPADDGPKNFCTSDLCPHLTALKSGQHQSIQIQVRDKEGNLNWEERVFAPIVDDQGKVRYIIESIRDITRVIKWCRAPSAASWPPIDPAILS